MNYVHHGEIDSDYIKDLSAALNSLAPGEPFYHYISSHGGNMSCCFAAIDMLNKTENVYYIAFDIMHSAAFHMFYKFKGPKRIQESTHGMVHQRYGENYITTNGKVKRDKEYLLYKGINLKAFREDYRYFKKLGLSQQQLLDFKNGEDVFFNEEGLNKLLNNQTNKNGKQPSKKPSKTSKQGTRRVQRNNS